MYAYDSDVDTTEIMMNKFTGTGTFGPLKKKLESLINVRELFYRRCNLS